MIPIGDSPRRRRTPYVNYALILVNVAVFLYMAFGLSTNQPASRIQAQQDFRDQTEGACYGFQTAPTPSDLFVCRYAFQPKEWFDNLRDQSDVPSPNRSLIFVSILTAMFLHAGWLHIGGNMLFLWVFGDNVEDRLGHVGYVIFYFAAGIVATLVQGLIDTASVVPVLGASGAIAGVLGAYLIFYPRATVTVVIPIFIILLPLPVPAFLMIGIWFLQNLFAGVAALNQALSPDTGVAFFAHVGGFVFGMLAALLLRPLPQRR